MNEVEVAEQLAILDEIRIAHELRRALWSQFGERSVPWMSTGVEGTFLRVRGSDGRNYVVTIEESP